MALMDSDEAATICKRDAVGRVRVPKARREALLDEFERSSLSGALFARAAGVHYQTFMWWLQQRRHARGEYTRKPQVRSAALRLVEAVVAEPSGSLAEGSPAKSLQLEVWLPGGARMTVTESAQVPLAAQLLRALTSPC